LGNQIKNTFSGVEIAEQHYGGWGGERGERKNKYLNEVRGKKGERRENK